MTNLQYDIRVPQKIYMRAKYTTGLGMNFYGTDVSSSCLSGNSLPVLSIFIASCHVSKNKSLHVSELYQIT